MIRRIFSPALAVAVMVCVFYSPAVHAGNLETIAVLPFDINADKEFSYVKTGISRMFYSRLSWPDKVQVIPPRTIDHQLAAVDKLAGDKLIKAIAEKTDSHYVLSGSITQLAGSFSIDAKVYDIPNRRYMAFYEQSQNSDELIEKVSRIAAIINQRVFDRSTVAWEKMEQERQKKSVDYKRRNPEHLMQTPPNWQPSEKIGWKIWKYIF